MLYYFMFFITTILVGFGEFSLRRVNKTLGITMFIVSVLIISVFAGMRDFSVGVDILVYGNRQFFTFSNFSNFLNIYRYGGVTTEVGYVFFNWFVSRFTTNIHMFYFLLSFAFTGITFCGIYKLKRYLSITFAYFIFLLTTWYLSLNLLRQSLAMSIVFYSISCFINKEVKKSLFICGIAVLFHYSSLFILVILLAIIIFDRVKISHNRKLLLFIIFVIIVLLFADRLLNILQTFNFDDINQRYTEYTELQHSGGRVVNIVAIVRFFFPTIICLLTYYTSKSKISKNELYVPILFALLISTISTIQGFNYIVFGRLSYYLLFGYFLSVPIILHNERNSLKRYIYISVVSIWAVIYFYMHVFISLYGGIYPFVFK
ncbi:Uncharacterised protein [Enterococcus casseliflavus]|nr:Uncharacterised protein [Enterococcus casseliflavus]